MSGEIVKQEGDTFQLSRHRGSSERGHNRVCMRTVWWRSCLFADHHTCKLVRSKLYHNFQIKFYCRCLEFIAVVCEKMRSARWTIMWNQNII